MTAEPGWWASWLAVVLGLAMILTLLWLGIPNAQEPRFTAPQSCWESLPCLRQRVLDLKDYRDFQDDQLALVKALNQDLLVQLAERAGELNTCRDAPKELPPREGLR